ncbi:mercury resistance system transport protein MerF [Brevundimonas sp.]|uniref:mercury resistance system transport protein MerF n=1 Tax=Brevundimonas sp. TaxID=1871086 RepID=UPI003F70094F
MTDRKLLGVGLAGAAIAALCCFTPVLLVLAGLVGLSALVGYLDYALIAALAFFIGLAVYALMRRRPPARRGRRNTEPD